MESDLDVKVDAAWHEFIKRHPYAGKTHEAVFKYAYAKALKDNNLIDKEPDITLNGHGGQAS